MGNAEKSAKNNKLQFEMLTGKVSRLETTLTDKVIEKIDPQIKSLKNDLKNDMKEDIRSIVSEEVEKRIPASSNPVKVVDNSVDIRSLVNEEISRRFPEAVVSECGEESTSDEEDSAKGEPT